MRLRNLLLVLLACSYALPALPEDSIYRERRQHAALQFHDGVVLLHASSLMESTADGFRQDPYFFDFTGLGDTVGALLAIDGESNESWLFLPSQPPYSKFGFQPEAKPGADTAQRLGIAHVVDWSELKEFLASRAAQKRTLYYAEDSSNFASLPSNLLSPTSPRAPAWLQIILQSWPQFQTKEVSPQLQGLMEVQSAEEIAAWRKAAGATVTALTAGLRAIQPEKSQRRVEATVENACWEAGAHGSSFWPWVMAGDNAVFPTPFFSDARYSHLDRTMKSGELVRLDVGCEWDHLQGDLGRTVPVSGRYDQAQRETWNIFVDAYRAGARALREGVTVDQVFQAWQEELLHHRTAAKTPLAQHAIDFWSDRKHVPFWQVHTTNVLAGHPAGPLRAGTTINFEPIAAVDGQGFFLEDMYLITPSGAELLTPGVPYSADEIEAAMTSHAPPKK